MAFSLREKVPDRADEGVKISCIEKKLIIELDGGQHNEDKQRNYDKC
jgi:very-short-patch-repair endonuclease